MNCAVHADREAVGFCRHCGKALCSACTRPVHDVLYCEDCLASQLGHGSPAATATAAPPPPAPGSGSPALAFILGFCVPGLGAVYNGEYGKALVHVAIFSALVVGVSSGVGGGAAAMLGIMISAFVFYMAFDAMRTAQAKRAGQVLSDPLSSLGSGKPTGALFLIGLGILFLLFNFGVFEWYRINEIWPVILIVLGVVMLWKRLGRS